MNTQNDKKRNPPQRTSRKMFFICFSYLKLLRAIAAIVCNNAMFFLRSNGLELTCALRFVSARAAARQVERIVRTQREVFYISFIFIVTFAGANCRCLSSEQKKFLGFCK